MNKYILLLSLFFMSIIFTQCGRLKLNPKQFYQSDFPIDLNNYWEYVRVDSVGFSAIDTLTATITEAGIDLEEKNLHKQVWRKKSGELVDSQYIKFRHNKLIFYRRPNPDDNFLRVESQYEFPFKPNGEWEVGKFGGIYTVQENVEDSSFGDAFSLNRVYHPDLGEKVEEDILVGKDIGIIERRIAFSGLSGRVNHIKHYRLLSYHIEE